jgi:hypothetical protein
MCSEEVGLGLEGVDVAMSCDALADHGAAAVVHWGFGPRLGGSLLC